MANPMAPKNPAPRTTCARGAAAPEKRGAASVVDEGTVVEGTVVEGTVRKRELETVTGDTGVDLELEAMVGTTGVDGELETTDVVQTRKVPDDDEFVKTGATGETGETGTTRVNEETDDHWAHVVELLLGTTGATGV